MALRHAAALAAAFVLCAGAPALAQNAPITNPPTVIIPAALPDLLLTSPAITATCNANKTVTINLKATFKNIGQSPARFTASHTVATASWGYASGKANLVDPGKQVLKPSTLGPATIAPGASHTVQLSIAYLSRYKPMSSPGQYTATAIINPNKSIAETNHHNNGVGGYVNDPCFGK